MRGNSHVRFLGGGGAVMRCCYPTFAPSLKRKSRSECSGFFMPENPLEICAVFLHTEKSVSKER
ncbi:hypothetical protein AL536_22840 [Vibrio fluvialis]|uniref:DUF3265 domain-containing protein n=1 Tax=Vibrio fluvialis TaxID=676 RepID=A0ABM6RLU4_VIBFL|nr:hypothetical protein AL536_22840 [Vibrio fluvialis]EKO4011155.1 hypothetical protein [Vibrio fluvialis]